MAVKEEHPHYYKDVSGLKTIDIYRILALFNVTDPTLQHAIKKLLVAGQRGAGKDQLVDVGEALASLRRFFEMHNEDSLAERQRNALTDLQKQLQEEQNKVANLMRRLQTISQPAPKIPKGIVPRSKMPESVKRQLATARAAKRTARKG